jgi:hypothetical protein
MACVAKDEEPGRSGDARGGQQDEGASDGVPDGDHLGSSVCHCEPDVPAAIRASRETDGCLVEPPEGERRGA